jgi:hypothetical protein
MRMTPEVMEGPVASEPNILEIAGAFAVFAE